MRVFLINASVLAGAWLGVALITLLINKLTKNRRPLTEGHSRDITLALVVLVGMSLIMSALMSALT